MQKTADGLGRGTCFQSSPIHLRPQGGGWGGSCPPPDLGSRCISKSTFSTAASRSHYSCQLHALRAILSALRLKMSTFSHARARIVTKTVVVAGAHKSWSIFFIAFTSIMHSFVLICTNIIMHTYKFSKFGCLQWNKP